MYLQKKLQLHKLVTTNRKFFLNRLFQTCIIAKRTCISIFSRIVLVDQSKTCLQIYLRKNRKLHKFATTILKKVYAIKCSINLNRNLYNLSGYIYSFMWFNFCSKARNKHVHNLLYCFSFK